MPKEPGAVAELLYEPPEDFRLFGDGRDRAFVNAMGAVIARERQMRRAALDEALAERVLPQLRKISELELEVAALRGAVDVLRGASPPPPPRFPSVKVWKEGGVSYAGDIVTFAGGTYQAKRDTARAPGSQDWVCLAVAGAGLTVRGGPHSDDFGYRLKPDHTAQGIHRRHKISRRALGAEIHALARGGREAAPSVVGGPRACDSFSYNRRYRASPPRLLLSLPELARPPA